MKFFKISLFIIITTTCTRLFAQDNELTKSEEISSLTIKFAKTEAKKSALHFVTITTSAKLEKPLYASSDLSKLQKVENEIVLIIKDQAPPTDFNEKIVELNQENQKLQDEIIAKKTEYFKILDSIPALEKEFGFTYESNIVRPRVGNSGAYFLATILIIIFMLVMIAKIKVISVRRWWRSREPEWTIIFRWFGFSWLLPILICSCQSGKTSEIEFYNPKKIMEMENQAFEDKQKKLNKSTEEVATAFEIKIQEEPNKAALLRKCAEFLESFRYNENLKIELQKNQIEQKKIQNALKILEDESTRLKRNERTKESFFFYLFITSILISFVFIFWSKAHLAKNSKVCPRCFEFGTLMQAPEDKNLLRCTSEFCKENRFRLPKRFQSFPKLSFPMIGCGSAGKTHWLLNIYSLNKISALSVKKKSALFSVSVIPNEEFNDRIKYINITKTSGGNTKQTTIDKTIPPLIFSLNDNQNLPLGFPDLLRSKGISLCFDYAGELMDEKIKYKDLNDMVSRSNGIVLFLDPISIDSKQIEFTDWKNNFTDFVLVNNNYDTQYQTNIINKTYADFIIARDLAEPNPLDLPVAICLSKIDLLPFQGPLKGTYGEKFLTEIENCKHPANKWSLTTIMKRSNLIRDYLPLIFAHKGMIEIFDQKFGSNYMFFPVANRGLDPDLSFGDPFGVMEPLLWLQHMHGFNVLDS